jgi:hypothetical protein
MLELFVFCIIIIYMAYTVCALPDSCKILDYTTWTIIKHGPIWWIIAIYELFDNIIKKHNFIIIKKEKRIKMEKIIVLLICLGMMMLNSRSI